MNFEFILFLVFLIALVFVIVISKRTSLKEQIREDYDSDGFLNPNEYRFALTDHARERMAERLEIYDCDEMEEKAFSAYRFGISQRQASKKASADLRRIESKNENSVALLYDRCIYIFSKENVLITVYKYEPYY